MKLNVSTEHKYFNKFAACKLLKETIDRKVNASIRFHCMEKEEDQDKMKDKAQRARTRRNPKRHIPLVSLLLWRKMVAVRCFVWPPALQLWTGRQEVWQCFLVFNAVFVVRWTNIIPYRWFSSHKMSLG